MKSTGWPFTSTHSGSVKLFTRLTRLRTTSKISAQKLLSLRHRLWSWPMIVGNLAGCGKNADGWSFRGAGFAPAPRIHEDGLMKSMVWPVFLDSGPGPKGRPGMTAKFFRTLLELEIEVPCTLPAGSGSRPAALKSAPRREAQEADGTAT